jgi:N-acetyl-alpha-D-glucosaminyl L-malate synthase BshA
MSGRSLAAVAPRPPRAARERALRVGVLALGGLGGSSRVACDLARGLADRGHATCVLSSPQPWWCPEAAAGVGFVPLAVPREPRPAAASWVEPLADALVQVVVAQGLQVLSVHYGVGLAAAAVKARRRLAKAGRALRVCATLHGTDVTWFGEDPEQGPALARALQECDAVTAVSSWLADRAQRTLGLPRRPEVIANGVDTELFRPQVAPRRPSTRPLLCHASNFRPVKRPLDALEILARVRREGVDAELMMVGDGPLRMAAREHARALGLDDHVSFLPPVSPAALAELLRVVDLSLVTSESESFGLFALESMASGVPVLGTRCGGLQEVLAADDSGELAQALIADVGDVDALARLATAVLATPHQHQLHRLRQRALALGRTAFPRQRQVHAFADVLGRGVAGGSG